MIDKRIVILFVKLPEKGKVKSRLARDVGEGPALLLYECMVLDAIDMLKRTKIPFRIFFDPPQELAALRSWLGKAYSLLPQTGIDLGERMELAFQLAFDEGAEEAVLIGTDIPALTASVVTDAFGAFKRYDAVIGPANDGGYYLIGFRKKSFTPSLFRTMTWSTDRVFEETLDRLRKAARTVLTLPEYVDVDTRDDLRVLLSLQSLSQSSRTQMFLMGHRTDLDL
jgi:hypothetical protein